MWIKIWRGGLLPIICKVAVNIIFLIDVEFCESLLDETEVTVKYLGHPFYTFI